LTTNSVKTLNDFMSDVCKINKLCGRRHNMPRPSLPSVGAEAPRAAARRADCNVAVGHHIQYIVTLTAAAA